MNKIIDAYQQFFVYVKKEDFFKFGLENIITIDNNDVYHLWKLLLSDIKNKEKNLYVRSFGRNGSGNEDIRKLYKDVMGIDINFDPTNNQQPTQLLEKNTIYKKNKNIFNYQVSHVFGNTKNVYCFTAPWNVIFIPKIVDPFTGHEAKGEYIDEFKKLFNEYIVGKFNNEIKEYNKIMEELYPKIENWAKNNIDEKTRKNILKDFMSINSGIRQ